MTTELNQNLAELPQISHSKSLSALEPQIWLIMCQQCNLSRQDHCEPKENMKLYKKEKSLLDKNTEKLFWFDFIEIKYPRLWTFMSTDGE